MEARVPVKSCQNMVDELGLNFGSPVTSTRTSRGVTSDASIDFDSAIPTGRRESIGTALDVDAGTCADPDGRRTTYSPCGTPTHILHATRGQRAGPPATELAGHGSYGDDSARADCAYRNSRGDAMPHPPHNSAGMWWGITYKD